MQIPQTNTHTHSFSDGCDKVLDESAYGDFSTRPSDIKLYMSDILKHVTNPFPMHVLMFKDTRLPKMLGLCVCVCVHACGTVCMVCVYV